MDTPQNDQLQPTSKTGERSGTVTTGSQNEGPPTDVISMPLPTARCHWLTPTRLKSYTTLIAVAVLFTYLFFVGRSVPRILAGHTPYIDLVVFWVVAKNTLGGHAQDMYDLLKLHQQVLLVCPDEKKWQAWSYPPLFYLVITPLGAALFGLVLSVFLFDLSAGSGRSALSFAEVGRCPVGGIVVRDPAEFFYRTKWAAHRSPGGDCLMESGKTAYPCWGIDRSTFDQTPIGDSISHCLDRRRVLANPMGGRGQRTSLYGRCSGCAWDRYFLGMVAGDSFVQTEFRRSLHGLDIDAHSVFPRAPIGFFSRSGLCWTGIGHLVGYLGCLEGMA